MYCGKVRQKFRRALRQGTAAVHYRHLSALLTALLELHSPLPQVNATVYRNTSTSHCSKAVWLCTARVPLPTTLRQLLPTAPKQYGIVLQESHCPLPQGSTTVYGMSPTEATGHWVSCGTLPHCLGALGSGML